MVHIFPHFVLLFSEVMQVSVDTAPQSDTAHFQIFVPHNHQVRTARHAKKRVEQAL